MEERSVVFTEVVRLGALGMNRSDPMPPRWPRKCAVAGHQRGCRRPERSRPRDLPVRGPTFGTLVPARAGDGCDAHQKWSTRALQKWASLGPQY